MLKSGSAFSTLIFDMTRFSPGFHGRKVYFQLSRCMLRDFVLVLDICRTTSARRSPPPPDRYHGKRYHSCHHLTFSNSDSRSRDVKGREITFWMFKFRDVLNSMSRWKYSQTFDFLQRGVARLNHDREVRSLSRSKNFEGEDHPGFMATLFLLDDESRIAAF